MGTAGNNRTTAIMAAGSLVLALVLVIGTIWMGRSAKESTENAVRSVSLLYLDELAGRREQVVENNLQEKVETIRTAIDLLTEEDLSDKAHLEAYQTRMKRLYTLEKFAFVDTDGLIYTSQGMENNIDEYAFNYRTLDKPDISIFSQGNHDRRVIIAVPVNVAFLGKTLSVCFMAMDMEEMLSGVSMTTNSGGATFCNLYTKEGVALTNAVLGGLAAEDNLLDAMRLAAFEAPYSYDRFAREFQSGERSVVSFTYNGIRETLTFIPVSGTEMRLSYLIRESVISDRISDISSGMVQRSIIQSVITVAVMLVMFSFIINQTKKNSQLLMERQTAETESRVKQEELEQRLVLQDRLLQETKLRQQQDELITALSSDFWSVYYLDLDKDEGICYRSHSDLDGAGFRVGERFPYLQSVTAYANQYITEQFREKFLCFVQPDAVREGLEAHAVISYTYMVTRHGRESYETVRFAGVRLPGEQEKKINKVGACFVNADTETRKTMAQQQALSDALAAAEEASKAKTVFLSNMSHEIRTPMNAIIGLDSIALNDPDLSDATRGYLEKIGASADHLLRLINDILDMSRIESGRMTLKNEEFSFPKLLEAINVMFSSQCQEKGLDYMCRINGEVDDHYIGDSIKLRQVLINILGNAVKFTPEGGRIVLTVERKAQFDGKSTLCFTVADTGIGMSREFLPHVFDTFAQEDDSATNRYGSSGLGLAITKNIVEMMNGDIQIESEKGKGTTFYVTVTLNDSAQVGSESVDGEVQPGEMTVLIVDDDPVACEHARLVLKKAGITAEIAASGAEAVEMSRLRHARMEPYNLILMDWQMPGMDGVETTRRIRSIAGNESAIVILTAYRWDDVLEEALQAGVDGFLSKPIFAAAVLEEFRSAVKKRASGARERTKAKLEGRRVLLAEDVQVNAEIIKMLLQTRQIETDHAENGKIAVEMFSSKPVGHYDAILMDMRMPEMDGLEATRTIRAMDREDAKVIPIIALTANAFDEDVQRSLQAGLDAHLSKPVQPEVLFGTLEDLIAR